MVERIFDLPDPGEGLVEAELTTWFVAEGDVVELNQPIAEVETVKAVVEIPSPYAGTIVRLHATEGAVVPVGASLVTYDVPDPAGSDVRATPAVRRLARDLGVDLTMISGSGPEGRVTAEDVRSAEDGEPVPPGEVAGARSVALSPLRRQIAATLEGQAAIPQVTTFRTVDCAAVESIRADLDMSPLPLIVAALVATVGGHPLLNAGWDGSHILIHDAVNVGLAVDTDRGLMVPVIREAGGLSATELATEVRRLSGLARDDQLQPADASGATITVSNAGSYGSEAGTPLLPPGVAVILGIGAIALRAAVVDGQVVPRPTCTLSLTFDHRVLDGATVGRALTDLVGLLQDSVRLRDLTT